MRRLTPTLYHLDLGIANAYLIRGREALVLVDAGIRRSLPRLERMLARGGFKLPDLSHLFLTHAHPDHVGDFPRIHALSGAPVWAHRLEAPVLSGKAPVQLPDPGSVRWVDRVLERGVQALIHETQASGPVHRVLEGHEHLSHLLPDLRVVHLPGHARGQIGFYHQGEGWLIGGDVMMNLTGLTFPMAAFTPDPREAWSSILKVSRMEPKILALGHGRPLINPRPALEAISRRAQHALATGGG